MTNLRCAGLSLLTVALVTTAGSARAEVPPLPPSAPVVLPAPAIEPATAPQSAPPPPSAASAPATVTALAEAPPVTPGRESVRLTYESTRVDRPAAATAAAVSPDDSTVLHGFRLGYGYVMNYDKPAEAFNGQSLKDKVGLRSPHHFLLGYEIVYRVVSHSWLNVLLFGNAIVAGLEQSKVLPSANLLIGFELKNTFQIGVGANLSPLKGSEGHTIVAAGWTPRVGDIYTPVHFFFIPDVDGVHRMGVTTGVTF